MSMNLQKGLNRIQRLSIYLTRLAKGNDLSTPKLVQEFQTTKKIIQTDFKEYLLPLYEDKTIYYSYVQKAYLAKEDFLSKTFLSAEELAVIAILQNKSKDKYTDSDLAKKTHLLFQRLEDELSNRVYIETSIEKIDTFKREIIQIKNAIESKYSITCTYNKKKRYIYPLKILNLEGYWYLIVYEVKDEKIKTYHLNSVKKIDILEEVYCFDEEKIESFENAITAYYKPEEKPLYVELFIQKEVAKYFQRKPLSKTQRVIREYEDGSFDMELTVTDYMEIIPTIQRYIPYIGVIEPVELKEMIKKNIQEAIEKFE